MRRWVLLAMLWMVGCAGRTESFRPTEAVTGEAPTGDPQSVYDLRLEGTRYGEAKVWSAGAYRAEVEGDEQTLVHMGIEIENASDAELEIDPRAVRLEAIRVNGGIVPDAPMVGTTGGIEIAPDGTDRFEAYFELPDGTNPQDVDAFQVRWSVAADGQRYRQVTPFTEVVSPRTYAPYAYYYPYYPYYPSGFYYDWYFRYPFHHRDFVVRHHVPHGLTARRHLGPPDHFPHHAIRPHHQVRPHHMPDRHEHHSFAPHHHHRRG